MRKTGFGPLRRKKIPFPAAFCALLPAWLLVLATSAPSALAQAPTDPALPPIRERMLANDDAGALALLEALPVERAAQSDLRYLRARLYERIGKPSDALSSLPTDLHGLPDSVATDICSRRALLLARSGHCDEARPLLQSLTKTKSDTELSLRSAECALSQADVASALVTLRELVSNSSGNGTEKNFAAHLLLARALRLSGERSAAVRELHQLYVTRPAHPRIDEVVAALRELGDPLHWSDDEHLERADHLLEAVKPEAALEELEHLHAPKAKSVRGRVLHLRGMALFRLRTRYAQAAKVLAQAAAISGDNQASDSYHAARALARADRDAQAVKAYRAFAKRFPDSRFTSDALHDAAWLELRHDLPGGEAHMRAFLADADKRGDHDAQQSALWELAFHAFERKQPSDALPLFERYAATSNSTLIRTRGLYWAARSALLADKPELARKHWHTILAIEPLHWYALLSQARLRALGDSLGDPFLEPNAPPAPLPNDASTTTSPSTNPSAPSSAPPPSAAAISTAPSAPAAPSFTLPADVLFYANLGLVADASAALHTQEDTLRAAAGGDSLTALIAAYQSLQEYARACRLAEREHEGTLRTRPLGPQRAFWDALYPRPYAQQVLTLTEQQHLPLDFIYSIMRRESAYDPTVVSSADAVGLLQLIEPTAKQLASALGISPFKRTLLFQPEINLRLGSRYLADLLSLFHGQAVPAIAAYNAGEHRVSAWLARAAKRGKVIEVDRFVEDIPIEQTRNYVRAVMANWARYRYLADASNPLPIELPLTLTK